MDNLPVALEIRELGTARFVIESQQRVVLHSAIDTLQLVNRFDSYFYAKFRKVIDSAQNLDLRTALFNFKSLNVFGAFCRVV